MKQMNGEMSDPPKKLNNLKGISIRNANYLIIFAALILYVFILLGMFSISQQYQVLTDETENYISCQKAAADIMEGSNILTEQVRLYAVTAELSYAEAYFQEVEIDKRRESALNALGKPHENSDIRTYLQAALDQSNALMETEIHSMKLVSEAQGYRAKDLPKRLQDAALSAEDLALDDEAKMKKAQDLVFGPEYRDAKSQISDEIADSLSYVLDMTETKQKESADALEKRLFIQRIEISLLFVMNVVIFFCITLLIVKPLQIYIRCIKDNKTLDITGAYEFKYLALTYNDIYELNATNESMLRKKAERDALTGILNRGTFDQLRTDLKIIADPIALLLIDVDKFKTINDTYGHETGDRALKKVADLLTKTFRTTDFPARIGGDEFAVIMTKIDETAKDIIAKKAEQMNEILLKGENGLPQISLSIGIAFSEQGFDEGLYKRADQTLYKVKEAGRCGYAFYEEPTSSQ